MDLREYGKKKESFIRHPWERGRLNIVNKLLKKHFIDSPKNILDVGAGDAYVINEFSKQWDEASCYAIDVEYNEAIIDAIKVEGSHVQYVNKLQDTFECIKGDIDLILLLDVIEHIEDVASFLKQLVSHPRVTSNTIFMITVPAYQALFCQHDEFLGHYRRYTTNLIKQHGNDAGLKLVRSGYFFSFLLAPRIIQVLREKLRPVNVDKNADLSEWNKGKWFTNMVLRLMMFDFWITSTLKIAGINLPGLSSYGICKIKN